MFDCPLFFLRRNKVRVLALDQSTSATGVSFFNNQNLVDYVLIKPKVSKKVDSVVVENTPHLCNIKMPEEMFGTTLLRTTVISDEIEKIIKNFKPDVVYFEEIFENANPKGFRSLARLQGFICHICHQNNVRYQIVEEGKWINSFGVYGRGVARKERKADIMKKINDLYGLDIQTDDVSDAIAIGTYAVNVEKENKNG